MSHVESVSPAGPLTVLPGESVEFDVTVSGVPGDQSASLRFTGSDGSTISVGITVDLANLEGIIGPGTPAGHQVLAEVFSGPGTLEALGSGGPGIARFRYTAAA